MTLPITLTIAFEQWSIGYVEPTRTEIHAIEPEYRERNVRDYIQESWQSYAGAAAMPRITREIERHGIQACGIFSGIAVERWPRECEAFAATGSEIAGHSYAQDIRAFKLDRVQEQANILRTADLIEGIAGERPVGWLNPGAQSSDYTRELLVAHGFRWIGDGVGDDGPSVVTLPGGPLCVIPYQNDVNDLPLYAQMGNGPDVYIDMFQRKLAILLEEAELGLPRYMNFTVHAAIYGRPWGVSVMRECIEIAKATDGVEFKTRAQIADATLGAHDASVT
jgi:peptidoglycan/xylan/chitin deacetylase (PgdA/CDA1 family)